MVASTGSPRLVFRRYFLSQLSYEAGCISISRAAFFLTASRRTVLMCPSVLPGRPLPAGRPDLWLWVLSALAGAGGEEYPCQRGRAPRQKPCPVRFPHAVSPPRRASLSTPKPWGRPPPPDTRCSGSGRQSYASAPGLSTAGRRRG